MTHQQRQPFMSEFPELELSLKLSQLEGAFKFLDYMNSDLPNAARNVTEQQTVKRNLDRVVECRKLFNYIINKNRKDVSRPTNDELAQQQFIHDS
jgi:hypothetical protein